MLYSKLGSIPKPETDGTEGWIEVPEAPAAPEGKEVVWWFPPGWVIRDPKPEGNWNWSQSEEKWVEAVVETETAAETEVVMEGSEEIVAVGTAGSATSV
jgi:hypothetical protein